MLDLKFVCEHPDEIKANLKAKKVSLDLDKIVQLEQLRKKALYSYETKKAQQNKISKLIGQYKKEGKSTKDIFAQVQTLSEELKKENIRLNEIQNELRTLALQLPNILDKDVPFGYTEGDNRYLKEWGKKKEFKFKPLDHLELAKINNLLDFNKAAKLSGSGFALHTGSGAKLERGLINFMLDFHAAKHGYTELSVPFLANSKTMTGTGQLPKMKDDMYKIENEDLYLIPTAEVPITNYFANTTTSYKNLPQKFMAHSACFRKEAGSYGKETKGLQRLHQFNKVELVQIVKPSQSPLALEEILHDACQILEALNLHYRVITLCSGDTSFASAKTYDIEIWAPGQQKYLEVSSVSNFRDFQARRANIKYKDEDGNSRFAHTLNGSGVALPRLFIALIESYQQEDGSINFPNILKPYLKGGIQ